jgi:hypothetical protein
MGAAVFPACLVVSLPFAAFIALPSAHCLRRKPNLLVVHFAGHSAEKRGKTDCFNFKSRAAGTAFQV